MASVRVRVSKAGHISHEKGTGVFYFDRDGVRPRTRFDKDIVAPGVVIGDEIK